MTDEQLERLSKLDKILFDLRTAMLKGTMSRGTDHGYHTLTVTFETMGEMTDAWKALYHAIRKHK